MRVVTWNLFFGRARPPAGRDLRDEFAGMLAGWDWTVALLQEVPWWWPPALARATGAAQRHARTAPTRMLTLRRCLARRWPDLMRSGAGGCNAILARAAIADHRVLALRPGAPGRVMHAVALEDGTWLSNLHASTADRLASEELERARAALLDWAGGAPAVLGGDLNLERPAVSGFAHAGGHHVDHVFARGLEAAGPAGVLDAGRLSDHRPLAVTLRRAPTSSVSPRGARSAPG